MLRRQSQIPRAPDLLVELPVGIPVKELEGWWASVRNSLRRVHDALSSQEQPQESSTTTVINEASEEAVTQVVQQVVQTVVQQQSDQELVVLTGAFGTPPSTNCIAIVKSPGYRLIMPAPGTASRKTIVVKNASTGSIHVESSELIDGRKKYRLTRSDSVSLYSDGSTWHTLSKPSSTSSGFYPSS